MEFIKKYFGFIIGGIIILFLIVATMKYTSNNTVPVSEEVGMAICEKYNKDYDAATASDLVAQEKMLGVAVPLTLAIILVLSISTLGLSIYKLIEVPSKLIKFLIPFSAMVLFILVTYWTADDDVSSIDTSVPFSKTELKIAGAIMTSTFILIFLGIGSFVGLRVFKAIKS